MNNKLNQLVQRFAPPIEEVSNSPTYFLKDVQFLMNLLVFFIIWPSLNVFGNSITFYIFILLLYKVRSVWTKKANGKILFIGFSIIVILSAIFAPYEVMPRHTGLISTILITTQWLYWLLLATFIVVNRNKINYIELSRWVFYGTIAATIGFYLLRYKLDMGPLEVKFNLSRNSYVFTLLVAIPVSIYYLVNSGKKKQLPFYLFGFLFVMLLTNGRSGGIIVIIEMLLISSILYRGFHQLVRFLFVVVAFLFFLNESNVLDPVKEVVAENVANINPRLAALIRGEEGDSDGDLEYDKSWLLRVLMVQKGEEIVEAYPWFGIGPNNFPFYDAELEGQQDIERLSSQDKTFLNSRSSHNSYVQVSSEFGLVGLFFLLLILFIPVLFLLKKILFSTLEMHDLFLVSILGASMHFYAINTITGAIAWMFVGLAWVCLTYQKLKWLKI